MLVMVTKLKGGSGATTITRELATYAAHNGQSVAVIDLDGQASLTNWWQRRAGDMAGPALLQLDIRDIPERADALRVKYDLVLIDTPPSVHNQLGKLAAVADKILIPTRTTPDDLDTIGAVLRMVAGHGVGNDRITFVLTATAGKRSVDAAQAAQLLSERGQVLGRTCNRAAYYRPAYDGLTANETDTTSRTEIAEIYKNLTGIKTNGSAKKKTSSSRKNGQSRSGRSREG